ncbi:MAG: transposase [Solirubrobacteraceae bacterium]
MERDLLAGGERVLRVPTRLMADARSSAREPGKSDPIDGLAIARAAWREPGLPVPELDGPAREVRLLVDHRDDLVRERTRVRSRIRWHLHEIAPALDVPARGLRRQRLVETVAAHLRGLDGTVAAIARELLERIRELNHRVKDLEREITRLVVRLAPSLLELPGCGALTAAKIVGETAGVRRFRTKSAYARWNGTAPQPAWSGNTRRFRLRRGGNRQVNAALHRIAITQARTQSLGREYLDRRVKHGNTKTEALRLLRRRLSDVVYRTLLADEAAPPAGQDIHPHNVRETTSTTSTS